MSTLNIGGDKSDASYRYKMPALVTKIEGRGNGIKTVILNMHDLAKSLHIHPAYPTKYFGIELGAQSKFSASTDRAVVNGAHQPGDLAKILERFIQQFILCPVCKLPELKMSVKSSIKIDCAACGHNSTIKTTHKLAQYIIKNPPSALAEEEKGKGAKGKKVKVGGAEEGAEEEKVEKKKGGKRVHKKDQKVKKGEADADADAEDEGEAEDDGVEEEEEEEVVAVQEKPTKKKKEKEPAKVKEDDVWHTDTSKEAQQARKEAEFKGQRDAATAANIEAILAATKGETKEQPTTTLKIFLAQKEGRGVDEITAELKRISLAKGLDQPGKVRVLLESIVESGACKDGKSTAAVFHQYREVLQSMATDRAACVQMLCGVEELLGVSHRELLSAVPHVLKQLYDDDVCDEASIVGWYDSPPESSWLVKKEVAVTVREKAAVFVNWLNNAEDEEGEDDEDDEEEEDEEDDK